MVSSISPAHHVVSVTTSAHDGDNDCELTVRYNGVIFYIEISPSNFHNSPTITAQYFPILELLHSGYQEINDLYEEDAYEWATRPFEALFAELAPKPVPSETLQDCIFPDTFLLSLEALNDTIVPRRLDDKHMRRMLPGANLPPKFLERLATLVPSFHASKVVVSFDKPEDSLWKQPGKVITDDGQALFFKPFYPGSCTTAIFELEAYFKIMKADLSPTLRISRLHGVVKSEYGSVLGMLLTFIDHQPGTLKSLASRYRIKTPIELKQQWAQQVTESVAALHEAGLIWGDAKAENLLVDKENNAWIMDFGGGHTKGWVDAEKAGTVEGDLQGLGKILEFLGGSDR